MGLHKNAGLTVAQRRKIKESYEAGEGSYQVLADRFNVSKSTAIKWIKRKNPEDLKSGPKNPKTVITPAYKEAVLQYRKENENHGPITIAFHLKKDFSFAHRGTVLKILQTAKLTKPKGGKKEVKTFESRET